MAKYSHNSFYNKNMIQDTIDAGLDALELDICYSLFRNEIFISHSFRPLKRWYCDTLADNLDNIAFYNISGKEQIKYVILESKSFWIPHDELSKIMYFYLSAGYTFVMSVQSKWWVPWQIPRGIWLKSFYKKYKEELGILDKRTESSLNEQINLYPRYNFFQRIWNNQF